MDMGRYCGDAGRQNPRCMEFKVKLRPRRKSLTKNGRQSIKSIFVPLIKTLLLKPAPLFARSDPVVRPDAS